MGEAGKERTREHTAVHPPHLTHMHTNIQQQSKVVYVLAQVQTSRGRQGRGLQGSGAAPPDSHQVTEERLAVVGFEIPAEA